MGIFPIFLYYIIGLSSAAIIIPTNTATDTEYYIASESGQTFANNRIQCGSLICIVTCDIDEYSGCYKTTIVGSSSINLILNCMNYRSCHTTNVVGSTNKTEINCLNKTSCYYADFGLTNTPYIDFQCNYFSSSTSSSEAACSRINLNADYATNVNIECIEDFDCYLSTFDVSHADTVTISTSSTNNGLGSIDILGNSISNKLTVRCDECYDSNIYCPNNGISLCEVICTGSNSCYNSYIHMDWKTNIVVTCIGSQSCQYLNAQCLPDITSVIIYDSTAPKLYKCSKESCCPFNYNSTTIYCPSNDTVCIINCNDYPNKCKFVYIDESNITKSLTVNCDGLYYCQGAHIHINKEIESFSLNCLSSSTCRYISVNLNVTHSVSISCSANYACQDAQINIKGISLITDIQIITQNYGLPSSNLNIVDANKINISCKNNAFGTATVIIANVDSVNIDCTESYSCTTSNWNINANNVSVNCFNSRSCISSTWDITANESTFDCSSTTQDYSCSMVNFIAHITNSLSIATSHQYAFSTAGGFSNSQFNVYCSTQCINTYKCMQDITFYCNDGLNQNITTPYQLLAENNDQCSNCICNNVNDKHIYSDYIWDLCPPTMAPTTNPSIDPTSDPTIDPTNIPSIHPTINPTTLPTINPTINPTNNPTSNPTFVPTVDPTENPITSQPTTTSPSTTTSSPPTMMTTIITIMSSTTSPSSIIETFTTIITTPSPTQTTKFLTKLPSKAELTPFPTTLETEAESTRFLSSDMIIILIMGGIIVFVLLIILAIYCIIKCSQNNNNNEQINEYVKAQQQAQIVQVVQVVPVVMPLSYNNNNAINVNNANQIVHVNEIELQNNNNEENQIPPTVEGNDNKEITYQ